MMIYSEEAQFDCCVFLVSCFHVQAFVNISQR